MQGSGKMSPKSGPSLARSDSDSAPNAFASGLAFEPSLFLVSEGRRDWGKIRHNEIHSVLLGKRSGEGEYVWLVETSVEEALTAIPQPCGRVR